MNGNINIILIRPLSIDRLTGHRLMRGLDLTYEVLGHVTRDEQVIGLMLEPAYGRRIEFQVCNSWFVVVYVIYLPFYRIVPTSMQQSPRFKEKASYTPSTHSTS